MNIPVLDTLSLVDAAYKLGKQLNSILTTQCLPEKGDAVMLNVLLGLFNCDSDASMAGLAAKAEATFKRGFTKRLLRLPDVEATQGFYRDGFNDGIDKAASTIRDNEYGSRTQFIKMILDHKYNNDRE